jgi:hypothetical protein
MFPKRLIALTLLASALAVMPACVLRAQWVQTNGPYGSDSYVLAAGSGYLFLGTPQGVIRSSDNGLSWESAGLTTQNIYRIAASGTNVVAAGIIFESYPKMDQFFLSLSTNGGVSWVQMDSARSYNSLAIHDSIFLPDFSCVVAEDKNLFAGNSQGVYVSIDNGSNWNDVDSEFTYDVVSISALGRELLVSVQDTGHKIFRSTNQGATWISSDEGIVADSIHALLTFGPTIFAATSSGIFLSNDSGAIWSKAEDFGLADTDVQQIAFLDSNIFATSSQGLFRSTSDGEKWTQISPPGRLSEVWCLFISGGNIFAGSGGTRGDGVFLSTDNGTNWMPRNYGLTNLQVMAIEAIEGYLLAGTGDGVFRSVDSGLSWTHVDSGLRHANISSFAVLDTILFAGTSDGVYKSSDVGFNWVIDSQGMNDDYWLGLEVNALAVSDRNLFAMTFGGLYTSTDEGATWSDTWESSNSTTIVASDSIVVAGNLGGDLLSTNSGSSWSRIDSIESSCLFISGHNFFSVHPRPFDEYVRVSVSTNDGSSWADVDQGLNSYYPGHYVNCIASLGQYLFAGTQIIYDGATTGGGGIWRRPLSEMIPPPSAVAEAPPVRDAILSYPNPFSQSTQIAFTSESAGYADISIVNLLGEQVARLFSGELDAGEHNFTFSNTAGLPDGMYECLLRMSGRVETLPMVVLR